MGVGNALAGAGSGAAAGSSFGPWGSIIGAGIGLFGSLFGAHMQASGASRAAQLQSAASNHAADVEAETARQALAFQAAQAENAFLNSEASRRGNYDQWAARAQRLNSVGAALGYGTSGIPAYVPGVDPRFVGAGQTPSAAAMPRPVAPGSVGAALAASPAAAVPGGYRQLQLSPGVTLPDPYGVPSVGSYLV